jgi:hypothetical protein
MSRKREPKFETMEKAEKPDLDTVEATFRSAKIAAAKAMKICSPAIKALTPVFCNPNTGPAPGTFAVDKYYRVYVCTSAVENWVKMAEAVSKEKPCETCGDTSHHSIAYVAGQVCHEAWHPLRQHMDRAQENLDIVKPLVWNIAADEEINDDLLFIFEKCNQPKLCLPPTHAHRPSLHGHEDGKLAEHYYFKHVESNRCPMCGKQKGNQQQGQQGQGQQGQGQQGQDQGQSQGQGQSGDQGQGQSGDQGQGQGQQGQDQNGGGEQGQGQGQGSGGQCNCPCDQIGGPNDHGSGVDGVPRPWDQGEPKDGQPGLSEAEGKMVRKKVAADIKKAATSRGTLPGGWERWAEKLLEPPKYDWRKELKKALRWSVARAQGDEERTYRRLGRRTPSLEYKAILASTFQPAPVVCIVQDTSGSMSNDAISLSLTEAEGIVRATGADVKFINCDMHPDKAQTIQGSVRNISIHGGGGTDMRIGIKAQKSLDQIL